MTPGWPDHLFVLIVMLGAFPFGGWIAYRRFLARATRIGDRALVQEYRNTLLWLAGLAVATWLVWWIGGRPLAALFATPPRLPDGPDIAPPIAFGAGIGLLARPVLAWRIPRIAQAFRRQIAPIAAFLPRTGAQLRWGLIVSLAAGLCEEIGYRGYLMPYLGAALPLWGMIAGGALIFGLAHIYQGWVGTLMTTLIGAALAGLYLVCGSLWWPIALHAAIDLSAMVTAYVVLRLPRTNAP
ncbi:CPBP family intramembrane glutamic endopeptidase [Sphingomonas abietis]|uniref:Type II CAAX endopeptidase family protein n=1 Tax=Sphingomonas abietis TaxID=3012344 RepID=A0ABY7NM62_9SPHN|nr:type II CAAX endopeptidase family protein [Sphingomonas abietis]WBO22443.1 type II CAAX endopeptidase family protein [Sphingomonas abietis]